MLAEMVAGAGRSPPTVVAGTSVESLMVVGTSVESSMVSGGRASAASRSWAGDAVAAAATAGVAGVPQAVGPGQRTDGTGSTGRPTKEGEGAEATRRICRAPASGGPEGR